VTTQHENRLGYSKKGYTNGEIGRAWIENFDKETRAKANGQRRLLLVDGHNSHYTLELLDYARAHQIEVLSYPSHSTHVYQGLDVVIFGPMKHNWGVVRDEWECKGHTVDKSNFLSVYAEAHEKTLTVENIKSAFRTTGVIPLNPNVITQVAMAPSLTTSVRTTVPIRQPSPLETISDLILDYAEYRKTSGLTPEATQMEIVPSPTEEDVLDPVLRSGPTSNQTPFFTHSAIDGLASTSAAFLTSASPIKSSSNPPAYIPSAISPSKPPRYAHLLSKPIHTVHEHDLREALLESEARDSRRKEEMIKMQAGIVLANIYSSQVQGQLQAAEEKKKNKGKKRLVGDGKAKFFSGDDFYALCVEDERKRAEEEALAEQKKNQRENHSAALVAWKKECEAVKERNKQRKEAFDIAVKGWEAERDSAKKEGRRPGWLQPRWKKDFEPEKLPERPKKQMEDEGGEDDDDDEEVPD
jgi:hypothetical protein